MCIPGTNGLNEITILYFTPKKSAPKCSLHFWPGKTTTHSSNKQIESDTERDSEREKERD